MTVNIPIMSGATYKVHDELIRVRESLRGRVKTPELQIAVSFELGCRLQMEDAKRSIISGHRPSLATSSIIPLNGCRVYVDGDLSGLQFRIVQTFPIKEVTNE